ncbi:MAG: MFS transporter [Bdellovibrionales bacterium]|nr:MFS transporter [Bdellovibrionales bacterium]
MIRKVPRGVLVLGLVSLCNDAAADMVLPVLPIFMAAQLGTGPAFLGLVEGIAEALASALKLVAGSWSDRAGRREPFVFAGYGLSNVARPLYALASGPLQVLGIRVLDRAGKGLRTSPRDAWLGEITSDGNHGATYGVHRAMDHMGSMLGPLLASLFLWLYPGALRELFLYSAIPGFLALALAVWAGKAHPAPRRPKEPNPAQNLPAIGKALSALAPGEKRFLAAMALFTLGNSADALLLLRLKDLGFEDAWLPLAWALLNFIKATSSAALGGLADRIGCKPMILAGWLLYAACYLVLGQANSPVVGGAAFLIYGLFFGLTEAPERAWVAKLGPSRRYGHLFGRYNAVIGLGLLPASALFGWVWERWGADTAFTLGAGIALTAGALLFTAPEPRQK